MGIFGVNNQYTVNLNPAKVYSSPPSAASHAPFYPSGSEISTIRSNFSGLSSSNSSEVAPLSWLLLSAALKWMGDKCILIPGGIHLSLTPTRTAEHTKDSVYSSAFPLSGSGHSEVCQKPTRVNFLLVKEHGATRWAASMHVFQACSGEQCAAGQWRSTEPQHHRSITSAGCGPRSLFGRRFSISLCQSEHFTFDFSSMLLRATEVLNISDVTPELSRTGRTDFTPTHVAPFFFLTSPVATPAPH